MVEQNEYVSYHNFHFCGEVYKVPSAKKEDKTQEQTEKELEEVIWFDRVVGANPVLQVGVKPYILRLNTI